MELSAFYDAVFPYQQIGNGATEKEKHTPPEPDRVPTSEKLRFFLNKDLFAAPGRAPTGQAVLVYTGLQLDFWRPKNDLNIFPFFWALTQMCIFQYLSVLRNTAEPISASGILQLFLPF